VRSLTTLFFAIKPERGEGEGEKKKEKFLLKNERN